MSKYNLNELSFLIGSFRDVINTFGENNKSVDFYKRQAIGLANIGQVQVESINLVNRVVGMENTNSVKWDSAKANLEQFILGIENTMNIETDAEKKITIAMMFKNGTINDRTRKLINEVYGIESIEIKPVASSGSFGKLPTGAYDNKILLHGLAASKLSNLQTKLGTTKELHIRVKNTGAICSGDPYYYDDTVDNVIKCLNNKNYKGNKVIEQLHAGGDWTVGYIKDNPDPCRGGVTYNALFSDTKSLGINWARLW